MAKISKEAQGAANREWGHEAEQIAADYFLKNGYTLRERNWRIGKCEIDLILELGHTIVFVEVKARKAMTQDPVDAVDRKKRLLIIRGADAYLRQLPHLYEYRFDIVTFIGDKDSYQMKHYADAYLPQVNGGRTLR